MEWLQDKKNLPIVIALVAVLIIGSGVFLYTRMKGESAPDASATAPGGPGAPGLPPGVPAPDAGPQMTGAPGGPPAPGAPMAPPGAPMPGPPGATAPTAAVPAASPTPAGGGKVVLASKPTPRESWRNDPFLPLDYRPPSTGGRRTPPAIRIPHVPYPFPLPQPKPKNLDILNPQPARRVAGIIYSQRVSALLQTPDGWETVRPGDKLRDGTLVERIERDRVVLKTTDAKPRLVTVKLAAAAISQQQEPGATAGPSALPGGRGFPGGPPGVPGGYGPPRRDEM